MAYGTINADVIQSSVTGVSLGAGNATRFKNRIINGNMVISQRGTSFTNDTTGSQYSLDRWIIYGTSASKFTVAQSATAPTGFSNSLLVTSSAATTVGASDVYEIVQKIEGFNFYDLAWGTANAKTITLSFQVQSSLTGTFGGALSNSANNRSYPFSYTISSANTWTSISVTIAGDTSGTWIGATNGIGVQVIFGLGIGSTYSGTANTWAAANYSAPTGAVQVVATNAATWYITGVQLEVGSSATGFEVVDYTTQLAMCQRYCYQISSDNSGNGGGTGLIGVGTGGTSGGLSRAQTSIPTMRTSPTLTLSNISTNGTDLRAWNGGAVANITGIVTGYSTPNALQFDGNVASSYTIGNVISVLWQNSINGGYIRLTAEL